MPTKAHPVPVTEPLPEKLPAASSCVDVGLLLSELRRPAPLTPADRLAVMLPPIETGMTSETKNVIEPLAKVLFSERVAEHVVVTADWLVPHVNDVWPPNCIVADACVTVAVPPALARTAPPSADRLQNVIFCPSKLAVGVFQE